MTHSAIRPNAEDLQKEILVTRKQTFFFANLEKPDFPDFLENMYTILSMLVDKDTDRLYCKHKALMLHSHLKVSVDIYICNLKEFDTFLT